MTPEPPNFPDDLQTVQPAPPRRSGALVFAVTGLAVLALALPLVFSGGEPEVGSTPTTVVADTTTTTTGSTSTTLSPVLPDDRVVIGWPVFLVQEDTHPNGNPGLVAFNLVLDEGSNPDLADQFLAPENVLFALGDLPVELPAGFISLVPNDVEIVGKSFERTDEGLTRVVLDMNREFLVGAGGALADFTMLNQIIFTTLQFDLDELVFTVEGEPVESFGSEGLSLLEPVNQSSFIDHLNPIIITEPATRADRDGLADALRVVGVANVFEATVSYRIEGLTEWYTTASCGTGCWGHFEIIEGLAGVTADLRGKYLEIYSESAKDGSATHVVRVPIPE